MTQKKKILFIAKNIPISEGSNTNRIICTIAKNLNEFYNISFFFPKSIVPFGLHLLKKYKLLYKLKDWSFDNIKVRVIPFVQLPGLFATYWLFNRLSKRAKTEFEKEKPELVHAHFGMPDGYLAYLLFKRFGVPYVLTLRTHDIRYLNRLKKWNPDYRKYHCVLKDASYLFVTNSYLQGYFKSFGYEPLILPHGIEKVFMPYEKTDDVIQISCVAHYLKRKNIEWVIDAVRDYRGEKKLQLQIIGDMTDMPDAYKQKCEGNILLLGRMEKEEVIEHLRKSDVFVLPSIIETFGLVYLEAAACGNAIIGHVNEGVCGVFEEDEEMLFAKDFQDFSYKLNALIDDVEFRNRISEGAYLKAKVLTWDNIEERYVSFYEKVINNS